MKKLVVAALFVASVVLAPTASGAPWSEPVDPTVEVTGPVLRYAQNSGPRAVSDVRSVREVRSVRTVRKVGEQR